MRDSVQALRQFQRHPANLENFLAAYRRRSALANGLEQGLHLSQLPLVLPPQTHGLEALFREAVAFQGLEIVQVQDAPAAKDFQAFLGIGFGAVCQVKDRADGAVRKTQIHAEAIAARTAHGRNLVRRYGAPGHAAKQVDEMASLADHAPAPDLHVLGPVIRRDGSGVDGHDHGLGLAHGLQGFAQGQGQGRKAAVEADHDHLLRMLARQHLDLGQLVQGQA